MKILLALSLTALLVVPAYAGDGGCCGSDSEKSGSCCVSGFDCKCACPLAKDANGCRALGAEADGVSDVLAEETANEVAENLGEI